MGRMAHDNAVRRGLRRTAGEEERIRDEAATSALSHTVAGHACPLPDRLARIVDPALLHGIIGSGMEPAPGGKLTGLGTSPSSSNPFPSVVRVGTGMAEHQRLKLGMQRA